MSESAPSERFSQREVADLAATWALFQPEMSDTGLDVFINFFGEFPEHQRMFPSAVGVPLDKLRATRPFRTHTDSVMLAVTALVDNLGNTPVVQPLLARVGGVHAQNKVAEQALEDFKTSFLHWLRQKLGARGKPSTMDAWSRVMSLLVEQLAESKAMEQVSGKTLTEGKEGTSSACQSLSRLGTPLGSSQASKNGTPSASQTQASNKGTPSASQTQASKNGTPSTSQTQASTKGTPSASQTQASTKGTPASQTQESNKGTPSTGATKKSAPKKQDKPK